MKFFQQNPTKKLHCIIKEFWAINDPKAIDSKQEKIIPDGYPEMIFHYGDPYQSNVNGTWKLQSKDIIAGQITNYFFLQNTGSIGMFAIKFQPWALHTLFGINSAFLTNKVENINFETHPILIQLKNIAISQHSFSEKVVMIEEWFLKNFNLPTKTTKGEHATQLIIEAKGNISSKQLENTVGITQRSLERYFKSHIGLSPKFYSRIIRFAHIFSLVQKENVDWADIIYQSGFYDQSHFIKNFKEFSGEDPSKYGFFENSMANFFLKK